MVLYKRYGCLVLFGGFLAVLYLLDIVLLNGNVLAHYGLWTETERETDDKSKPDLCGNLGFSWNAVLVLLEGLYVVIGKTEQSEPYGGYDKQNHVYIVQSADKKARDKYGYYDYYATHGGDSGLQVVLVELPQCLGNLFLLEVAYEVFSEN